MPPAPSNAASAREPRYAAVVASPRAPFRPASPEDPRWVALRARDASADGTFVFAVSSTGVYCRPSCSSRAARPERVAFFAGPEEAEAQGFRACARCDPRGPSAAQKRSELVRRLCALLEREGPAPSLEELGREAGLSPFHTQRLFRAALGCTPKQWARSRREERLRESLPASRTVTEAALDAGYGSAARFYADASAALGEQPKRFLRGGAGLALRYATQRCALGVLLVAATERGLCALLLGEDADSLRADLAGRMPKATLQEDAAGLRAWLAGAVAAVEEPSRAAELPLDLRGTAFQQRVWKALQQVPPGQTTSYSALARTLGQPEAVRAVARACGANPVAVVVPCHRVVGKDGALTGYRWGLERKKALLEREARRR